MIHVLGSINIDYAVSVEELPAPGETIKGRKLVLTPGGKGANQALAAKRAGAEVAMHGAVGTDGVAQPAIAILQADGVDLTHVQEVDGPTGCAFVFVDAKSENQIVIVPGANDLVKTERARSMTMSHSDVLLLQLECPTDTVAAAAVHAKQLGATVVVNLAPYISLNPEVFDNIDYLVVNEPEAAQLQKDLDLSSSNIEEIAKATNCSVIKTLGASGVIAIDQTMQLLEIPGQSIAPLDTVGAGDTFTGFLGAMLEQNQKLLSACKIANSAAALACTKSGAQTAIPTLQEVQHFIAGSGVDAS